MLNYFNRVMFFAEIIIHKLAMQKSKTMQKVELKTVRNLAEYIRELTNIAAEAGEKPERYFRGESKDHGATAFRPSIYRQSKHLENEPNFYREMQRFNDQEFQDDKTTFDKLSRMQHYNAPTRLVDMSEDALSALYFAVEAGRPLHQKVDASKEKPEEEQPAVVYVIDVRTKDIRYYDSDAVSVVANLAKSPLSSSQSESNQKTNKPSRAMRLNTAKILRHSIIRKVSSFCSMTSKRKSRISPASSTPSIFFRCSASSLSSRIAASIARKVRSYYLDSIPIMFEIVLRWLKSMVRIVTLV